MAELVDYGVSYGECLGYCTSVLHVNGTIITLTQVSNGPDAHVRRFTGEIESELGERIAEVAARLEPGHLQTTYGTPDARDEGAVTVRIGSRAGVTEHTYSRDEPPDELSALDALLSPILLGWVDGNPVSGLRFDQSP